MSGAGGFDFAASFQRFELDEFIDIFREQKLTSINRILKVDEMLMSKLGITAIGDVMAFGDLQEELRNSAANKHAPTPIHSTIAPTTELKQADIAASSNAEFLPTNEFSLSNVVNSFVPSLKRDVTRFDGLIRKILLEDGAQLAANLLRAMYSAYFTSRPNNKALPHWMDAFDMREKIATATTQSDKDALHIQANKCLEKALQEDFWLPFRYACLWTYEGNIPVALHRLEYEALHDIFADMEATGTALTPLMREQQKKIKDIRSDLSWQGSNAFRLTVCRKGCDNNSQRHSGCCSLPGRKGVFLCCPSHFDAVHRQKKSFFVLKDDVKDWDPCVSFYAVTFWPAPDSTQKPAHPFLQRDTSRSCRQYLFADPASVCGIKLLDAQPPMLRAKCVNLAGSGLSCTTSFIDVARAYKELLEVRNNVIGHGEVTYGAVDVWWTLIGSLMATHVVAQQAEIWTTHHSSKTATELLWYPSKDTCGLLQAHAEALECSLLDRLDDLLRDYIDNGADDFVENTIQDTVSDPFNTFLRSVSNFKRGDALSVLILPPLPEEHIPAVLAAAPWNVVVDFATNPTSSPAWKVFTAAAQSGFVKSSHRLVMNESRVLREQLEPLRSVLTLDADGSGGVAWWQPFPVDQSLLPCFFDTVGNRADVERINDLLDRINLFAETITDWRVLQNRPLQLVVPLYGTFEFPFQHSKTSSWFFKSDLTRAHPEGEDFAFAYFFRRLLRALTEKTHVGAKCSVLYQHSNSLVTKEDKRRFLQLEDTGLHWRTPLELLRLRPELLKMRYRFHEVLQTGAGGLNSASTLDAICLYSEHDRRSFIPLAHWHQHRPSSSSSSSAAADEPVRFDALEDWMALREESHRNLALFASSGIDLLHAQSDRCSLEEFEHSSLFAAFLLQRHHRGPRKNFSGREPAQVSAQALAVLKFYFSYPPAWALFSSSLLADDANLPQRVFVPREAAMKELTKKAEMLWTSARASTLIVRHAPRSGGTTLLRHFVYSVAFHEWKAVVLVLTERFNRARFDGLQQVARILQECVNPAMPIVVLADRFVRGDILSLLLDALKQHKLAAFLILLQHGSDGEVTVGSHLSVSNGKTTPLNIKLPDQADVKQVMQSMFQMARYFDPTVDVQDSIQRFRNDPHVQRKFRRVFFIGILRFAAYSTQKKDPRSIDNVDNVNSNSDASRQLYISVLERWMQMLLRRLYAKIDVEQQQRSQPVTESGEAQYSTLAAVRALLYLALVQLSARNSMYIDMNSLRIVFGDRNASRFLFEAWHQCDIEHTVLKQAQAKVLQKVSHSYAESSQAYGALLPFHMLVQPTTKVDVSKNETSLSQDFPALGSSTLFATSLSQSAHAAVKPATDFHAAAATMSEVPNEESKQESTTESTEENSLPLIARFKELREASKAAAFHAITLAKRSDTLTQQSNPAFRTSYSLKQMSLKEVFESLLHLTGPSPTYEDHAGIDADATAGEEDDALDDIDDLLWTEFLDFSTSCPGQVRFLSDDVAEVFLTEALKLEAQRYPYKPPSRPSNTAMDVDPAIHQSSQVVSVKPLVSAASPSVHMNSTPSSTTLPPTYLYVLAMSLLHTILGDTRSVDALEQKAHQDIHNHNNDDEESDVTLAWRAQHLFIERHFGFNTGTQNSSNGVGATHGDNGGTGATAGNVDSESKAPRSLLPQFQKWSWVLANVYQKPLYSSALQQASSTVSSGASSASSSVTKSSVDNAFATLDMKLLLAAQSVFFGYWRVSSTIARLMQFHLLELADELFAIRTVLVRENDGSSEWTVDTWYAKAESLFEAGTHLYLASSSRLLLAFEEIDRKHLATGGDGDRKKFAGTLVQLGNCIKSFLLLTKEALFAGFHHFGVDWTVHCPSALSVCLALGNVARSCYGLSVRVVAQPLGYGDEVDCWLHVLESARTFRSMLAFQQCKQLKIAGSVANGETTAHVGEDWVQEMDKQTVTENMQIFGGFGEVQWLNKVLYPSAQSTIIGPSAAVISRGGQGNQSNQAPLFAALHKTNVGALVVLSPPLFNFARVLDECHTKLDEFNIANLNAAEDERDKDLWYFEQNWNREEKFMTRLGAVEVAESSSFESWSEIFRIRREELEQLRSSKSDADVAMLCGLEKSLARFAFCMWQSSAEKNARTAHHGQHSSDRKADFSTWHWHRVMLKVNSTLEGQDMVRCVLDCLLHCVTRLPLKYPHRLMGRFIELVAYLTPTFLRNLGCGSRGSKGLLTQQTPFTVSLLLPMVNDWVAVAKEDHAARRCDLTSLACAQRFLAVLTCLAVIHRAEERSHIAHQVNVNDNEVETLHLQTLASLNGFYEDGRWTPGHLDNEYKDYVHFMERYVLVYPLPLTAQDKADGFGSYGLSLSIRRRFSIIDEGLYEQKISNGLDGSEDVLHRYAQRLLMGTVIHMTRHANHRRDSFGEVRGVVQLAHSRLFLPFSYEASYFALLEREKCEPLEGLPCSFYVTFLPWRIEAFAVQRAKAFTYETAESDLLSATFRDRVPLSTLYVSEAKIRAIAEDSAKRSAHQHHHRQPPQSQQEQSGTSRPVEGKRIQTGVSSTSASSSVSEKIQRNVRIRRRQPTELSVQADEKKVDDEEGSVSSALRLASRNESGSKQVEYEESDREDGDITTDSDSETTPSLSFAPLLSAIGADIVTPSKTEQSQQLNRTVHPVSAWAQRAPQLASVIDPAIPSGSYVTSTTHTSLPDDTSQPVLSFQAVLSQRRQAESITFDSDPAYLADLLRFSEVDGAILRLLSDADYYRGPDRAVTGLHTMVFGLVSRRSGMLETPYRHYNITQLEDHCSFLALPVHVETDCLFPWVSVGKQSAAVGPGSDLAAAARLTIVTQDAASLIYNTHPFPQTLGSAPPIAPLAPHLPSDYIPQVGRLSHLFVLFCLRSRSLVACREGLICLQPTSGTDLAHMNVAVLHFAQSSATLSSVVLGLQEMVMQARQQAEAAIDKVHDQYPDNIPFLPQEPPTRPPVVRCTPPESVQRSASSTANAASETYTSNDVGTNVVRTAPTISSVATKAAATTTAATATSSTSSSFPALPTISVSGPVSNNGNSGVTQPSSSSASTAANRLAASIITSQQSSTKPQPGQARPPASAFLSFSASTSIATTTATSTTGAAYSKPMGTYAAPRGIPTPARNPPSAADNREPCRYGYRCTFGQECVNEHNPSQQRVFEALTLEQRLNYKFGMCKREDAHDPRMCFYVHVPQDDRSVMFCVVCLVQGHVINTTQCPEKTFQPPTYKQQPPPRQTRKK